MILLGVLMWNDSRRAFVVDKNQEDVFCLTFPCIWQLDLFLWVILLIITSYSRGIWVHMRNHFHFVYSFLGSGEWITFHYCNISVLTLFILIEHSGADKFDNVAMCTCWNLVDQSKLNLYYLSSIPKIILKLGGKESIYI